MAGVTSVVIDGTTYLVDDINAVDFSEDQGLSEQQQQQGRSNIGAAAAAALASKADKADLDALEGTVGELSDDIDGLTEALADKASAIVDTASGAIASFPDGAAVAAKDITIGIEPVQSGSGDPSPTNVRPISGWTGANVTMAGKNLADINRFNNLNWTNDTIISNGITFKRLRNGAGQIVGISATGTATGTAQLSIKIPTAFIPNGSILSGSIAGAWIYFENPDSPYTRYGLSSDGVPSTIDFKGETSEYATLILRAFEGSILNGTFLPMIRPATVTDPTFEPYNPASKIYPISWQSEAGTVYGGTLDVTTGLLTVDRAMVDLGTFDWVYYDSYLIFASTSSLDAPAKATNSVAANLKCSRYSKISYNSLSAISNNKIAIKDTSTIWISDHTITNTQDFKAAMSGVQLVYELATPQTYQLSPTEVEMLLGDNNVWADTGDTTVTYRADTKLYIQKINAPTDDDMIADAQIASGRYFIVGGNLYKSTTTIPAGDTINPGSNCILTNLADALNALNT